MGHPPFGHNGEGFLDEHMRNDGGFEGNAQSLRIVTKLEKKEILPNPTGTQLLQIHDGIDLRLGLNLTARSIAAIIKYDSKIDESVEARRDKDMHESPMKGYYAADKDVVDWVRKSIGVPENCALRTIESSIMDIADDIAYSTYDLEDGFKSGFLSPVSLMATPDNVKQEVVKEVAARLNKHYSDIPGSEKTFDLSQLNNALRSIFYGVFNVNQAFLNIGDDDYDIDVLAAKFASAVHSVSSELCSNGYLRTGFTSELVGRFVRQIEVYKNDKTEMHPKFWRARLTVEAFKAVETLKCLTYKALIMSPRIKVNDYRGRSILLYIFEALEKENGNMLLPEDWRRIYLSFKDDNRMKRRAICDYISGMTDRYCIEFYARLTDKDPQSIFKPT